VCGDELTSTSCSEFEVFPGLDAGDIDAPAKVVETPPQTCEPGWSILLGDQGMDIPIAPGINGRLEKLLAPPPPGLEAASDFIVFEVNEPAPAVIGLPLFEAAQDESLLGFYTYVGGEWTRVADVTLRQSGTIAEGDFSVVPQNLVVLRVVGERYRG
jgi:hypothetical protein